MLYCVHIARKHNSPEMMMSPTATFMVRSNGSQAPSQAAVSRVIRPCHINSRRHMTNAQFWHESQGKQTGSGTNRPQTLLTSCAQFAGWCTTNSCLCRSGLVQSFQKCNRNYGTILKLSGHTVLGNTAFRFSSCLMLCARLSNIQFKFG